jgi:hypothetical protein
VADVLVLSRLIAPRDAARMALGRLHLGAPTLELLLYFLGRGALPLPAPSLFAVRRHRSSVSLKLAFNPGYHLTTG